MTRLSYRDTGVRWLGKIPSHWELIRTKFVARLGSGHTPSRQHPEYWENCDTPWFSLADVWQIRDGKLDYVEQTAENVSTLGLANSSARLLPAGTVLLSRTASVGFSAIAARPMATTQDFVNWVCGPRLLPEYLLKVFRAMKPEFERLTSGSTHQTIYMPDVNDFVTPLPPIREQRQIAAYLDEQTGKIDRLMDMRSRQMALLQEQRVALIAQAVTRGLGPHHPFSGVPWLSHVPAHWKVKRLKWVATLQRGYDLPERDRIEGDFPVVTSGGIVASHHRALAKGPGVVTGRYGSMGNVFYLDSDFWPHNTSLFVSDFHGNHPRFIFHVMQTLNYEAHSAKSAVPGVDRKDLHETLVAVPPIDEQKDISKFIDEENARFEALHDAYGQQLTQLAEFRAALIHEAVTGQRPVDEAFNVNTETQ
jgi:type I restriction enzyme S subunit